MPWVEADGVSLHYERYGQRGPSVAMLHELGGSIASWDAVLTLLGDDFQTVRMDLRGAGLSEKVRAPFSIADQAEDLVHVLAASGLAPPWHIAAVAAGAAVAVQFAAAYPALVASMILCCPATVVDPTRRDYLSDRADTSAQAGMRAIAEATLARSYPPQATPDAAIRVDYRARFLAVDPICYGLANRALAEARLDIAIAKLRCRCLVLAGTHDLLRPPDGVRAIAARISGAQFHEIESGHLMPVQAPAALASALRNFIHAKQLDIK
jgi:3-oxoadipate enol-lactonase